jgi:hypothetical protein
MEATVVRAMEATVVRVVWGWRAGDNCCRPCQSFKHHGSTERKTKGQTELRFFFHIFFKQIQFEFVFRFFFAYPVGVEK